LSRGDLSEVEWRILKVLLPVERDAGKRGRGRPPENNRNIINGILWRLRARARRGATCQRSTATGTRSIGASDDGVRRVSGRVWRSLSPRRWPRAGTTTSTQPRFAPTSRQRAEKGDSSTSSWPSRGGFTSKVHCLGDAQGRPIAFHLTPGEAADCKSYDTLIDLPEQAPDALLADKAYDTDAIRADLKERGIKPVIPSKSNRTKTIRYNRKLYRERNCIERTLGHLKINRAIATRYDQLAESFLGMLFIASARYWIKFAHAA